MAEDNVNFVALGAILIVIILNGLWWGGIGWIALHFIHKLW